LTEPVDAYLQDALAQLAAPPDATAAVAPPVDPRELIALFDVQLRSRHTDLVARWLQSVGEGFYTIGSSGHEGNAAVAAALRPTDPALLHYRSGAFYLARAAQVPGTNGVRDILLGLIAATSDPASGGRHKVFGNAALGVIPQTSTIASHLPRAVGVGLAIELAARLGVPSRWPRDAIAVCSFGDASINHSTAVGALNAASQITFRGSPLPVLFVCEDNGLGISVRTPDGWTRQALGRWSPLRYEYADGEDLLGAMAASSELVNWVRETRRPAILHLGTVRLMGHAGSDAEIAYRTAREITADYERDPVLATARMLVARRIRTSAEVSRRYGEVATEVRSEAVALTSSARLSSRAEVMRPLLASEPALVRRMATTAATSQARESAFDGNLPEHGPPLTLSQAINACLSDLMALHEDITVFGEDVARKGGVYGVTRNLLRRFGSDRVSDTLLDEQTILGVALGAAVSGLLPIPEIQYLAYLHNAEDQIRGEAASLRFFSDDAYRNGMVVRIPGLAYQKGFGGHFHNDNAVGALRDIPGLVLAVPASAADAPPMLRTCAALARVDGRVCVYLEPIAAYHSRDLHEPGDGALQAKYSPPQAWDAEYAQPGRARVHGEGRDLTIVTFGNGVAMSLRVARRLAAEGVGCRVVDLRWLAPLPVDDLLENAMATGRVLVADETRASGGVAEAVLTALVDNAFPGIARRVSSADSFIPLGAAAQYVLLTEGEIEQAARAIAAWPVRRSERQPARLGPQ
jgi:2-oxoisovalerate dehydrogenase E1 component